jgi:hypothetical protein
VCVAIDGNGNVVSSANPTGGAGAWSLAPIPGNGNFTGISCPSVSLCVAVTSSGDVASTTDPAEGRWTVASAVDSNGLNDVSCASASLCVAVGNNEILTSTDPSTGGVSWTLTRLPAAAQHTSSGAVSCPSVSLCVAVENGLVVTSANPTGGPAAWREGTIGSGSDDPDTLSCPSVSLCVIGAGSIETDLSTPAEVWTTTDPAAGAGSWRLTYSDPKKQACPGMENFVCPVVDIAPLSCPSASFCIAFDSGGNLLSSHDPSGGGRAWTLVNGSPGFEVPSFLSCASASLCVATSAPSLELSTTPAAGARAWSSPNIEGPANGLFEVTCPSVRLCFALDDTGRLLIGVDPGSPGGHWSTTKLGETLASVTCPSVGLCVAIDEHGGLATSTDPTGGAASWHNTALRAKIAALSCPSASFCLAVDRTDRLLTSLDPGGGTHAWTKHTPAVPGLQVCGVGCNTETPVAAVSCASRALCAIAGTGGVAISTKPTGSTRTWTFRHIVDPIEGVVSISCPSKRLCVATDELHGLLSSSDPGNPRSLWMPVPSTASLVRCPAVSLCLAPDDGGIVTSTAPAGGRGAWIEPQIDPPSPPADAINSIEDVSCPTTAFCVAVDNSGRVLIGTAAPNATARAARAAAGRDAVRVPVSCIGATGAVCTITLVIEIAPRRSRTKQPLGTTTTVLAAGRSRTITVPLEQTARRLLLRARTLHATLTLAEDRASGTRRTSEQPITLRARAR